MKRVKFILSLLLLVNTIGTAMAQTSAQKARQLEVRTAYSEAMRGIKEQQQASGIGPFSNVIGTVKREEASGGPSTHKHEFYSSLPALQSFLRSNISQGGKHQKSIEALFDNRGTVIFYFEKKGSEETRIYWNNDGTLSMTLQKASANGKQVVDKLDSDEAERIKTYLYKVRDSYDNLLHD